MASVVIINIDPGVGQIGTGFCVLVQAAPGGQAPAVAANADDGQSYALPTVALDPQRGLWSAYMDDGPDLGSGVITVDAGTCSTSSGAPLRT